MQRYLKPCLINSLSDETRFCTSTTSLSMRMQPAHSASDLSTFRESMRLDPYFWTMDCSLASSVLTWSHPLSTRLEVPVGDTPRYPPDPVSGSPRLRP